MTGAEPDRTMPGSLEAERAILGAILLDNSAYDQAAQFLQPQDFVLDSHRRIYLRMVELATGDQRAIDFVTLTENLGQHKEVEAVGGVAYVTSLTDGLPRVKNISQYVNIVRDKAVLRQLIHMGTGAVEAAYEQATSARHILGTMQDQLLMILGDAHKGAAVRTKEFSGDTWNILNERRNSGKDLTGLTTGVDCLDLETKGIRPQELWVIGGRTNEGKTPLALQMAIANARQGTPVAYFSVEMDRHSLLERIWSAEGRIDYGKIQDPKRLNLTEMVALAKVKEEVDEWPLFIEDNDSYSIAEIEARSRLLIRQHKVELIIVDYVQIVDAPGKEERHRVTRISNGLRKLAKGEGVAVVGVSQMPRPQDKNRNKRPTKFDLKESGSLENDSHVVVLIFRPVDKDDQYTGEDELLLAKLRRGKIGILKAFFRGRYQRFEGRV